MSNWDRDDEWLCERGLMSPAEYLDRLAVRFAESNNPIACWFAIRFCLSRAMPLPDFARQYLHFVATDICRLTELDAAESYRTPHYVPPVRETLRGDRATRQRAVLCTMGLLPRGRGRRPDAFEEWITPRSECLIGLVSLARKAGGMTIEQAYAYAAERWNVSERTVRNTVESARKKMP
jgi:hypothetical protein